MKKKRRSDIAFESALMECLKTTPIDKIRVEELCENSGYSRACFYQNYGSKENLCTSIIEAEAEKYHEMLSVSSFNPNDEESVAHSLSVMTEYFEYVKNNNVLYTYILNDAFGTESYKIFVDKLQFNPDATHVMSNCQSSPDKLIVYCHTLQRYMYGVTYFALRKWVFNSYSIPRKDLSILVQNTVLFPYFRESREMN